MIQIAIDGPSGAGKSTLSRALAAKLGYLYVDTGALYRSIGLAALRAGANPASEEDMAALLEKTEVSLRYEAGAQHVYLGSEDVSDAIRAETVSMAASAVSAHGAVRAFLLDTQRRLATENNVIMDGRDIGTVVLPDADLKLFLTAAPEERARRRHEELAAKGQSIAYETVLEDVKQRDHNDTHRAIAPLKKAHDAVEVITTGNEFEESLEQLYATILQHLPQLAPGGA